MIVYKCEVCYNDAQRSSICAGRELIDCPARYKSPIWKFVVEVKN